jgi:Uncharacterised nucleotidyltransferase
MINMSSDKTLQAGPPNLAISAQIVFRFAMLSIPQKMLMALLSTTRLPTHIEIASLCEQDWDKLAHMATEHRLGPYLHNHMRVTGLSAVIPAQLRLRWAEEYRQATINALYLKSLLLNLRRQLDQENIDFLALKGAWLAWHIYADAALRPMRDVDILLHDQLVIPAFRLLQNKGFLQTDCFNIPLEDMIRANKHLPGLTCPKTAKRVELHAHLHTPTDEEEQNRVASEFDRLSVRKLTLEIEGLEISYPSSADSLLHLIVHAVDDHFFNNGPVVLLDICHILKNSDIDWALFWTQADQGGWLRSVQLALDMVEYYHGKQPIIWLEYQHEPTPKAVIEAAAAISLQPIDARANYSLAAGVARSGTIGGQVKHFIGRLIPSKYALAEIAEVPVGSLRSCLAYPAWFMRGLRRLSAATPSETSPNMLARPVATWLAR